MSKGKFMILEMDTLYNIHYLKCYTNLNDIANDVDETEFNTITIFKKNAVVYLYMSGSDTNTYFIDINLFNEFLNKNDIRFTNPFKEIKNLVYIKDKNLNTIFRKKMLEKL